MDAEPLCDLGSRLVSLDRFGGDLGLQAGWVTLAGFGHWLSSILNAAHHLRKSLFSVPKMGSTTDWTMMHFERHDGKVSLTHIFSIDLEQTTSENIALSYPEEEGEDDDE